MASHSLHPLSPSPLSPPHPGILSLEGMARLDCDAYAHGNVNAEEALSYFQTLKDVRSMNLEEKEFCLV